MKCSSGQVPAESQSLSILPAESLPGFQKVAALLGSTHRLYLIFIYMKTDFSLNLHVDVKRKYPDKMETRGLGSGNGAL